MKKRTDEDSAYSTMEKEMDNILLEDFLQLQEYLFYREHEMAYNMIEYLKGFQHLMDLAQFEELGLAEMRVERGLYTE